MISSLYIDGAALWVAIVLFAALVVAAVFFGCAYTAEAHKNENLSRELGLFKRRLRDEINRSYRRGFKSALCVKDTEEKKNVKD